MIKPDIILLHPHNQDYPLIRYYLRKYRSLFHKVIIGFCANSNNDDYSYLIHSFVQQDDIITTRIPVHTLQGDWRQNSITACMSLTESDYILFLEPDLVIHNNKFFHTILGSNQPLVGFKESSPALYKSPEVRLHPALLLVQKDLLTKTSQNYSAIFHGPDCIYDHFGLISKELQNLTTPVLLPDLGLFSSLDCSHMKDSQDQIAYDHVTGAANDYHILRYEPNMFRPRRLFQEFNQITLQTSIEKVNDFLPTIQKGTM